MNSAWIFSPEFSTGLSRFEYGHQGEKIHAPTHAPGETNHAPIHAPFHARGKMSKFENSCTFSSEIQLPNQKITIPNSRWIPCAGEAGATIGRHAGSGRSRWHTYLAVLSLS